MRLITDKEHAQIVEALTTRDVRLHEKALATLQALPEVESLTWHPTAAAITALKRFEETCTDNEGYDVPKDTMRNLQAIGLIYRTYGDMYCITDYGQHILATKETS